MHCGVSASNVRNVGIIQRIVADKVVHPSDACLVAIDRRVVESSDQQD